MKLILRLVRLESTFSDECTNWNLNAPSLHSKSFLLKEYFGLVVYSALFQRCSCGNTHCCDCQCDGDTRESEKSVTH